MILTALVLGFAGSLHCLGMCSPLAIAVTRIHRSFVLNRLLYNSGRIVSYGLLGAIVSLFGGIPLFSEFQYFLVIISGIILFAIGVSGVHQFSIPVVTPALQQFTFWLKTLFAKFIQKKNFFSVTLLGMINGLLPCGLTYLALTYCLTLEGPLEGFYFMVLFGAGTLPVMLGFTSVILFLIERFQFPVRRFTAIMFILLGGLLIARVTIMKKHEPIHSEPEVVICQ